MVFSTSSFLFLFLPAVVIGYHLLSLVTKKLSNLFLFLVSLVFYCWNGSEYAWLLLLSVAANYLFAILLHLSKGKKARLFFLLLALLTNLGLLGYYKYANFFLENLSLLTGREYALRKIVLPVGISFYTFQALSYVIDVYRGAEPIRNPIDLGTYITFFPQLIAGPIVRYGQIRDSLRERTVTRSDFFDGMTRFLTGLCKKVILANNLGALADIVFNGGRVTKFSVLMLWLAAVAYSLQLYYDFSGYSDMAIGLGRLFGFSFPENFRFPYAASSITDFWRRWHMTLSGWFRDYVYIPLGGSRVRPARHILNLFLVWLLTGLWHGAAWQFLFWGLAYFLLLLAEKYLIHPERFRSGIPGLLYRIPTLVCICLLWVVFRAGDLHTAFSFIGGLFGAGPDTVVDAYSLFQLREYSFFLVAGLLFAVPFFPRLEKRHPGLYTGLHALLLLLGTLLSVSFIMKDAYNPFLYFQF